MTSNRKRASRPPAPPEIWEKQSPSVGRTGRFGRRAERPSEGSERKGDSPVTEPDRSKPPSPRAGQRAPAAAKDGDLPRPMRDGTA